MDLLLKQLMVVARIKPKPSGHWVTVLTTRPRMEHRKTDWFVKFLLFAIKATAILDERILTAQENRT